MAGNEKLMRSRSIPVTASGLSGTVIHVAKDDRYLGALIISDEAKPGAAEAVQGLRRAGISSQVMLTGDNASIAGSVADSLGLDWFAAGLLPQDKVRELELIMAANGSGRKTAFIGDGINDAPVLARADIGVAMGGLGSDAALEAADVVLMEDKPEKLLTAVQVAGRTRAIVWQNIGLALGVKLCVLGLGALGLATMWEAVFADVGVALLAILNAMRINFIRGTG
jgi:Cd2+/Zn2+-exporting ATPase